MSELAELVALASARHKRALGRLISRVEQRGGAGSTALGLALAQLADRPRAPIVGLTGAPGVGKSSLVGALAPRLADAVGSVAVVAVDPSSPISGGAFLGDRVRATFATGDDRLFFRSQAAGGALGGLAPATARVAALLARIFDLVLIETVGVGQNEIDVSAIADHVLLVVAPLAGDRLQGLKSGIVEVADGILVNKADTGVVARRAAVELRDALAAVGRPSTSVTEVSARTGEGIDPLVQTLRGIQRRASPPLARLRAEIARELGQSGLQAFELLAVSGDIVFAHEGDEDAWIRRIKSRVILQISQLMNDN